MMRTGADRLRVWLVVGATLLVLVVVGFLGYARYRSKRFLAGLPGRLGAEITRQADGYTWSQTVQGRTVFTMHAAKLEQRNDGKVLLHDVGIVLYGRKQDRADRIYGNEFEYDQNAEIIRAVGEVHMDLEAPSPVEAGGKKQRPVAVIGEELAADAKMIHVKTSGLVYLKKLGVAATPEDIEFAEGKMTGRAHGADYTSDTGVLMLQSDVRMNGLTSSGPVVLTASKAELIQEQQVANLVGAKVVTTGETVTAERAVVHLRKDGTPERMEGTGKVTVAQATGGVLTAPQAELALNEAGKAEDARFGGGVTYLDDEETRHERGTAAEARVRFDKAGQAERLSLTGGVEMAERERGAGDAWSSRTLTGQTVEMALGASGVSRKTEVRDAEAVGEARLVVVDEGVKAGRTEMAGDVLKAHFVAGRQVSRVIGTGHSSLHRIAAGLDEMSSGDSTEMQFRSLAAVPGKKPGAEELVSAVQVGNVVTVRKLMRKQAGVMVPVEEKSTAEKAVYDAEADRVTLTGGVQISDADSTVRGNRVVAERTSGNAVVEGGVRVNYASTAKDGEPVHVLADHAELKKGTAAGEDTAFFYGGAGKAARLWQGTSQVEAPVLEFEQGEKRLTASGPVNGMMVHTVLVGTGAMGRPAVAAEGKAKARAAGQQSPVRVASKKLVYTDGTREAVFSGGVLVEDADGTMKAQTATVYLQAAGASTAAPKVPGMALGGSVERVVANGKVEIVQPGRRAMGEQVVYTASDGMFVMTGTAAVPPRVEDEVKGTVTGTSLRFHSGDDSVVVSGGGIQNGAGGRPRTETRVKQ